MKTNKEAVNSSTTSQTWIKPYWSESLDDNKNFLQQVMPLVEHIAHSEVNGGDLYKAHIPGDISATYRYRNSPHVPKETQEVVFLVKNGYIALYLEFTGSHTYIFDRQSRSNESIRVHEARIWSDGTPLVTVLPTIMEHYPNILVGSNIRDVNREQWSAGIENYLYTYYFSTSYSRLEEYEYVSDIVRVTEAYPEGDVVGADSYKYDTILYMKQPVEDSPWWNAHDMDVYYRGPANEPVKNYRMPWTKNKHTVFAFLQSIKSELVPVPGLDKYYKRSTTIGEEYYWVESRTRYPGPNCLYPTGPGVDQSIYAGKDLIRAAIYVRKLEIEGETYPCVSLWTDTYITAYLSKVMHVLFTLYRKHGAICVSDKDLSWPVFFNALIAEVFQARTRAKLYDIIDSKLVLQPYKFHHHFKSGIAVIRSTSKGKPLEKNAVVYPFNPKPKPWDNSWFYLRNFIRRLYEDQDKIRQYEFDV